MADQPQEEAEKTRQLQQELFSDLAILGEVQRRMARRLAEADINGQGKVFIGTNCALAVNALSRACNVLLRWTVADERQLVGGNETRH